MKQTVDGYGPYGKYTKQEEEERLLDNSYYYSPNNPGISNSDIRVLNLDPDMFRIPKKETDAMVVGRYFHESILEPHLIKNWTEVGVKGRGTKTYKEAKKPCILQHEKENVELWKKAFYEDPDISKILNDPDFKPEVPGVTKIDGIPFKGKADGINHRTKTIYDLKTTESIFNFHKSAQMHFYNSQAYIYCREIWEGYDFVFLGVDKNFLGANGLPMVKIFKCSEAFLSAGRERVMRGLDVYKNIILPNPRTKVETL